MGSDDLTSRVAIVTDSTCDLPRELVEQYQIHVVPNILVIDGRSLEDGKDISREQFYEQLQMMKAMPTTATASAGSYQSKYEDIIRQGYQQVLSLHAASVLSGIYNAACIAADAFESRVRVIDSGQVSMGLGFQVLAAAEAAASGARLDDILNIIAGVQQRIRLYAMLDTLEYIRRSGRVSWARARLGEILHIKPFIELKDGQVFSLGQARTYQRGIDRLHELLVKLGPIERLAILHTNAEEHARQFIARMEINIPAPVLIVNVTTIIGTHVGPNGVGFTAVVA
jgi:DegV family protein with EDD domain